MRFDVSAKPWAGWAVALIALLPVALFYVWLADNPVAGVTGDGALYLLMAKSIAGNFSGDGYFQAKFAAASWHPPGYPFLLAIFGGDGDIRLAHLITSGALVLSLLLFYRWAADEIGHRIWAAAIALIFAFLSPVIYLATDLWSEFPFMLISFGALLAMGRYEQRGEPGMLYVAALLVGASFLVRAAGVSFVAAFVLWGLMRWWRRRELLVALAIAVVPPVAWFAMRKASLSSYSGDLVLGDLAGVLAKNVEVLLGYWAAFFDPLPAGLAYALLVAAAVGWGLRLHARRIDAIYLAAYAGVILIWPYPSHQSRFLVPILPFLLMYIFGLMNRIADPRFRIGLGYSLIALLSLAPVTSLLRVHQQVSAPLPPVFEVYRKSNAWLLPSWLTRSPSDLTGVYVTHLTIEGSRLIADHVPEGACVWTTHYHAAELHGGRAAFHYPGKLTFEPPDLAHCSYALVLSKQALAEAVEQCGFEKIDTIELPWEPGKPPLWASLHRRKPS